MVIVNTIKSVFRSKINNIEQINVFIFNSTMEDIEKKINYIVEYVNRFKIKKDTLMEIDLKKASSLSDMLEVLNENISNINDFLINMSEDIYDNKIDSVANMGDITDISFMNDEMKGHIDVLNNKISINIQNKQKVIVSKDEIKHSEETIVLKEQENSWWLI